MTDAERDQIDNDAQAIIKTCRETINRFRGEAQKQKVHPQVKEHRAIVIFLIDAYLKGMTEVLTPFEGSHVHRLVCMFAVDACALKMSGCKDRLL